jgi:ABC-2 type transport system permease protein
MVAHLLRLKLILLANTFRRSPWQMVGMILALLYGLVIALVVVVQLVALRTATAEIAHVVTVVFGSILALGFTVLPLVFGVDDTVDPRRFSLYGIESRRLATGLLAAAFVSVPSAVVAVFALAQVATWSRGVGPVVLALVGAVLIVLTCVLAARVSTAVASFFLASRRARDISGIVLVLLLAAAAPFIAFVATVDWQVEGLTVFRRIAAVAAWTPFGAAWSIPGDAADGNGGLAALRLVIAVVFVGALWFVWRWLVDMMLVNQMREAGARAYLGLGWFGIMPATPTGVIAARSLTYWGRDARYRVGLTVIPVVPIIMVAALLVGGLPWSIIAWIPVPIMCLFLGWSPHNDVAYDNTAFWIHVSASTSGVADRWGRLAPALFLGAPLVLIGSTVTVVLADAWWMLPGLVGLSACILGVGLGISSLISAAFPYTAVHPGESPFAQPQGAGTAGSLVQGMSFFLTVASSIPVLVFVLVSLATASTGWMWLALAVGLAIGTGAVFAGVHWGGRVMSRRAPELLAFTLRN